MNLIWIGFTVFLLFLNVAGLTILVQRYIAPIALARAIGVVSFCLILFFVEHFIGLGQLTWLWPMTSVLSVFLVYRQWQQRIIPGFWSAEFVFYAVFLYVFAWRFAFPSIYPSSEHVTDLYFIANYLDGTTLPPTDHWYPQHKFTVYYAFQHYAAALLARIFGLDGGTTYHVSFALLVALPAALAWEIVGQYIKTTWLKVLLLVALVSGGTGISPIVHFLQHIDPAVKADQYANKISDQIVTSQRFIGLMEKENNTELAKSLFPPLTAAQKPTPNFEPRELPMETYGYQIFLGDYHPPLGGYLLLMMALALIVALEANAIGNIGQAALAATIPIVIVTNTWVFPLQTALVLAWIGFRYWDKRPPNWFALIIGGGSALTLLYPFLSEFALHVQNTPIRFVSMIDHTPWRHFIALHWPLLVLLTLGMIEPTTRKLSMTFALTFAALLFISELIYVDDPTGDKYERTNTTMKWWGWIWCGGLVALATVCLNSQVRWIRWLTIFCLISISTYAIDLVRYYIYSDKTDAGQLSGHRWMTHDSATNAMINYLIAAPAGIVLENQYDNAYCNTSLYALFTNKPAMLGWPMHLLTWRGDVPDVWITKDQVIEFYTGKKTDSRDWLLANDVQYIIWTAEENSKQKQAYAVIDQQIKPDYLWKPFYTAGDYRVGMWVRQPQ